jgi:hypothetical protein
MKYNVLWLEDEPADNYKNFIGLAEINEFHLIQKNTALEAVKYLDDNYMNVDAAILDAKVFKNSSNEQPSSRGLSLVINALTSYKREHNIPYVVFTSQQKYINDEGFRDLLDDISIFDKGGDNSEVLNKLKTLCKDSEIVRIREKYRKALAIFDNKKIGEIIDEVYDDYTMVRELDDNKNDLEKMIVDYEHKNYVAIPNMIRNLFEGLVFPIFFHYQEFKSKDRSTGEIISNDIFEKKRPVYNKECYQIENNSNSINQYMRKFIAAIAFAVPPLCHSTTDEKDYFYNNHVYFYYDSLVNGILTILAWLPDYVNEKENKE